VITGDGWARFNIWEHSATVRDLYARRCRREAPEMTAHRQAVRLLTPHVAAGDTLLDAGCGSGYFFHSLRDRMASVEYHGVDATAALIDIGREILPAYGLSPDRLSTMRIEDLHAEVDHVVCINVLSNIDSYHRPLERLLLAARKSVILRESIADFSRYTYVEDNFLDPGVRMKVHVNTYPRDEVLKFIEAYGYDVRFHVDDHTGGKPEEVIGHPHWWTFVEAVRRGTGARR
jgi:cyclopropane fatty-acyl-phospholipid synthase-like methyltransferase